jgi:hypothetical protein
VPAVAAAAVVAGAAAAVAVVAAEAGVEEDRMTSTHPFGQEASVNPHSFRTGMCRVAAALALALPLASLAQQNFPTPEAAVDALAAALKANDEAALVNLVGPKYRNLVGTGDSAYDAARRAEASAALASWRSLDARGENRRILKMGHQAFPFAIPIVREGGNWHFAADQGAEELLNRRIGANERNAIQVLRAYVDAQRQYASEDRDGDGVVQYARRVGSSPGKNDGLYWDSGSDGQESPFGPLLARSEMKGHAPGDAYRGYHFRILERQGSHAKGGAYNYVINGRMVAGFAMVAYPHDGNSGVMTFVVNQNGRIFQKSLGARTLETASKMTSFDPGPGWTPVEP